MIYAIAQDEIENRVQAWMLNYPQPDVRHFCEECDRPDSYYYACSIRRMAPSSLANEYVSTIYTTWKCAYCGRAQDSSDTFNERLGNIFHPMTGLPHPDSIVRAITECSLNQLDEIHDLIKHKTRAQDFIVPEHQKHRPEQTYDGLIIEHAIKQKKAITERYYASRS